MNFEVKYKTFTIFCKQEVIIEEGQMTYIGSYERPAEYSKGKEIVKNTIEFIEDENRDEADLSEEEMKVITDFVNSVDVLTKEREFEI